MDITKVFMKKISSFFIKRKKWLEIEYDGEK